MNEPKNTREVILHTKHYVFGETLDYGAGTAKYQGLVRPHASTYTTFDMVAGEHIDIIGDVLKPPFADASFDTIISTQVLEHVERPWVMVAEMNRILRPGGVCIVTAPFMIPYHADPYDFFRYTTEGLKSLFKNENFEVIESGTYGKSFAVFSEMVHFIFFNPYNIKKKNVWALRVMRRVERVAGFFDRFVKNKIIYPNVYIVVRKNKS